MDRFTIQRKISNTLLGATYECSYIGLHTQPSRPNISRKPALPAPPPRKRASVAIKCSSLATRERLLHGHTDQEAATPVTLDDPLRERAVVAALIASGGHTNVLQCYDHFTTQEDEVCVVTEFCGGGDLFSYLEASSTSTQSASGLGEQVAVSLILQVARGVAFLQSRLGLAHRDLSLENVLLRDGTCKLADFGLAVPLTQRCHTRAGKQLYMAPEVLTPSANGYDPAAADVWSLGVMLFVLLTGSPLVDVASREDPRFTALVDRGVGAILGAWGVDATCEVMELLNGMLSEDPAHRPTVSLVVTRLEKLNASMEEEADRRSYL